MKKIFIRISICSSLFLLLGSVAKAQAADTTGRFQPHGMLWGYSFGDFSYKGDADSVHRTCASMPFATMGSYRHVYLGEYTYNNQTSIDVSPYMHAKEQFLKK
jgi:hypothetical protein